MCGIIGYKGPKSNVAKKSLKQLEYRGYDSAGIAAASKTDQEIRVSKSTGTVDEAINQDIDEGHLAIGHTRWATHGGVTKQNAHPHTGNSRKVAVVHNGIIHNHRELKTRIGEEKFKSETDTEVIPHLLEQKNSEDKDIKDAAHEVHKELEGSYAALAATANGDLVAWKNGGPMVAAEKDGEVFFSSDVVPLLKHVDKVTFLKDGDIAVVKDNSLSIYNNGQEIERKKQDIGWEAKSASKKGFTHFTRKEIGEQTDTVKRAVFQDQEDINKAVELIENANKIHVTGCGTASYAADHMKEYLTPEENARSIQSHELEHRTGEVSEEDLVIAISQSGETADLLSALDKLKAPTLAILNTKGSTLDRKSNHTINVNAGPEIGVASTKAYTAQIAASKLISGALKDQLEETRGQLVKTADKIENVIEDTEPKVQQVAGIMEDKEDAYFIGRHRGYHSAKEASLKVKELSYIHSESLPSGELKHGNLALVEKGTPVLGILTSKTRKSMLSGLKEAKSRGATTIGIGTQNSEELNHLIQVPEDPNKEILEVIPAQLLAFELSIRRGNNPDKPRNLAKSVTVK